METLIENFRLDTWQVAAGAASRQYSDSYRSLMDKWRRLLAPDFQIPLACSHDEQFQGCGVRGIFPGSGACHPAGLQGSGVFQISRPFRGGLATGSSSPEPFQKPSLEILEMKYLCFSIMLMTKMDLTEFRS